MYVGNSTGMGVQYSAGGVELREKLCPYSIEESAYQPMKKYPVVFYDLAGELLATSKDVDYEEVVATLVEYPPGEYRVALGYYRDGQ